MILFQESGEGGGPKYAVYLRNTDGSPAIRLGEGSGLSLSPDGKWALSRFNVTPSPLVLYPTGVGEMKQMKDDGLNHSMAFLPDGKRLCFRATEPGHGVRLYVESLDDAKAHAFSPEGVGSVSSCRPMDAGCWAWSGSEGLLVSRCRRRGETCAGTAARERVTGWSADGRSIFVMARGQIPAQVFRVDVATGQRTLWKTIEPADAAGIDTIGRVLVSADDKSYVYGYNRTLSDLYLVQGLK